MRASGLLHYSILQLIVEGFIAMWLSALAFTWPQGVLGDEDRHAVAAQVHGGVGPSSWPTPRSEAGTVLCGDSTLKPRLLNLDVRLLSGHASPEVVKITLA